MDILETIDWTGYIVGAMLSAICAVLCFRRAEKNKESSLFYYLLTGFYACIFMSDVFYLLSWMVTDYPFVFSPGDISWVGGLLFLITAALGLVDTWAKEQRQAAKRYRLTALIAPAVCIAFNIAYISIYPEITLNYLLYGVPTAILAYFTLWLFLAGGKGGVQPQMRPYHLAALAWVGIQLFYDLFYSLGWDYGYAIPAVVSGWIITLLSLCIYFAARKEAGV